MPIGTVPIYQAVLQGKELEELTINDFLEVIEHQARQGVDYMTLHAGILLEHLPLVYGRITGIVSRGGSLHAVWMMHHRKQNPLYEHYDDVLDILRQYDVTISLGDSLRPGCLHDASDKAQFAELDTLGELTKRAWEFDVQVMVEGPGHIPMDQIEMNVRQAEGSLSRGALLHSRAARHGHLAGLRSHLERDRRRDDRLVRRRHALLRHAEGASRSAERGRCSSGRDRVQDRGARGRRRARSSAGARDRDDALSRARYAFDWNEQFRLSLDPERAREYHDETLPGRVLQERGVLRDVRAEVLLDASLAHDRRRHRAARAGDGGEGVRPRRSRRNGRSR